MAEQPVDWIEQEIQRILDERSSNQAAPQFFMDYIPEGEERKYPGQGAGGQSVDYVPEGYTANTWIEKGRREVRKAELEELVEKNAAISAAEKRAKKRAEDDALPRRVGRNASGDRAA